VPAAKIQGLLALDLFPEVVEVLPERVAGLDPPPALVEGV
jgi:hypothetical protein